MRSTLCNLFLILLTLSAGYALGDEVVPPEVITRVPLMVPENPPEPLHEHVLLELTIEEDGSVQDIVVIESAGEVWDQAAVTALKQWHFKPAQHQGRIVASRTRLTLKVEMPPPPVVDAGHALLDGGAQGDAGVEVPVAEPSDAGTHETEYSTTVRTRTVPKSVAPSDFHVDVKELAKVPRKTATDFLKLAPGILITNEGGEGHPDQIFLRGFDAREGQDIELSTDGVPVNESGNLHGNGYADMHFIIPELIESLRVVEGPFDPRQGNYAVAGSADYEMGLEQKGLTAKFSAGAFNTQRLVFLWGAPGESSRSFAGVHAYRTSGWGSNRDAQYAGAMGQHEFVLSDSTTARIGFNAYAAKYHSAGIVRADDVAAGRVAFDGTYDNRQGGDTLRGSVYGDIHYHAGPFIQQHQFFVVLRQARIDDNPTGFLEDTQLQREQPHAQRGDLIDRNTMDSMLGLKGFGRYRGKLFGLMQEIELGYFGRLDFSSGLQQRIEADTNTPYKRELDLDSTLGDIGLYANANFQPVWWLTLRGGIRTDMFTFAVHNKCAVQDVRRPSSTTPPGDASCLDQTDFGKYREPDEHVSAVGTAVMPRGTLILGPFKDITISGAVGQGVRSIDPQYVSQNVETPFASIFSYEGGLSWSHTFDSVSATARGVGFSTRVDKDLIFSEQAGRNVIGGATTRVGGLAAGRVRGSFYDIAANATYVQSTFDDTKTLVPYVPDLVMRGDAALFHALPWLIMGSAPKLSLGIGYTFVGQRPLPFGQRSDVISVLDLNVEAGWKWVTLGLSCTNLLDTQYRLGEYNYASDFRTSPGQPTLVPARAFTAGAPRQVMFSVALNLGGKS